MTVSRASRPGGIVCPLVVTPDRRRAPRRARVPRADRGAGTRPGRAVRPRVVGRADLAARRRRAAGRPGCGRPGRRPDPGVCRRRRHGPRPDAGADRPAGPAQAPTIWSSRRRSTTRSPRRHGSSSTSRRRRAWPRRRSSSTTSRRTPTCRCAVGRRALAGHPTDRRDQGLAPATGSPSSSSSPSGPDDFSVLQGREQLAAISLWSRRRRADLGDGQLRPAPAPGPRSLGPEDGSRTDDARPAGAPWASSAVVFDQGAWLAGLKATLQAWAGTSASRACRCRPATPISDGSIDRIVAAPGMRHWLTTHPAVPAPPPSPSRD